MYGSSYEKSKNSSNRDEEWDHPCELVAVRIIFALLLVGLAGGLGTYS